ncbi:MAG: hypothetical protein IJD83_06585 [Clostridia bacterium]|nr:hypothetical protein [Clostridia bacterium]
MTPEEKNVWELMKINRFLFDLKIIHNEALADAYAKLLEQTITNIEESGFSIEREKAAYLKLIKDLIRFLVDSKERMGFEKDEYDEFVADLL